MSDVDNPTNTESPTPQLDALTQAAQLVALGRSSDALSLLERLIEQDPASPQLYFLRAQATQQAGGVLAAFVDVRAALALGRRIGMDLHPLQALSDRLRSELSDEVPLLAVARATTILRRLLFVERLRAAEELVESLLPHLGGYRPLLLLASGLSKLHRGRAEQAIADFESAIEQHPSLWPASYACGEALLQIQDLEGAARAFDYTVEQRRTASAGFVLSEAEDFLSSLPGFSFVPHRFAFDHAGLLHSLGKSEEAIAVLDGLIQEEPDAADAYLSKAVLLSSLRRWDAALSSLKQAEETLRPDDRQSETDDPLERILRLRVEGLVALGRTDEAQALRDELPRLLAQKPADLALEQP
ncbi:MAG: tetratricopeptide repeat protein [Myxococcales bacterium]|nr:tetratricopeptide repeat protein [Myxococcales bacterium]